MGERRTVLAEDEPGTAKPPEALALWVELAKVVKPAVVNVSTTSASSGADPTSSSGATSASRARVGQESSRGRALGSGFIASADGYVVTNFHVVRGASEIVVRLADHSEHRGRLVGSDPKTDIALLKIDWQRIWRRWRSGTRTACRCGEPVVAIGNPFGLEQTVTTGIVSAKERLHRRRTLRRLHPDRRVDQPGNSGGPAGRRAGRPDRHQLSDLLAERWLGRHRLRHPSRPSPRTCCLPACASNGRVTRGYLGVAVGCRSVPR